MSEVPLYTGLYPVLDATVSPDLGTPRLRWGVVCGFCEDLTESDLWLVPHVWEESASG